MDALPSSEPLVADRLSPTGLGERLAVLVRVRWLFALGAFIYAALVVMLLGTSPRGGAVPTSLFLAALPLLVLAQNAAVAWAGQQPDRYGLAVFLSLAGDLASITIALHGTGGVASWLWGLYPFVTLEAAFLTRDGRQTAATAVVGVAAYALVQALEQTAWLAPVVTPYTADEQARPASYVAAKVAWVAFVSAGTTVAGLAGLKALDRARLALEEAYRRLADQYAALRELDRLKGNFLSVVSHELRTPLTVAGGYAELAEDDPGLTAEGHAYLAATTRAISGLAANVEMMLAYASLAGGDHALSREPVSADEVVQHVFEGQAAACREAGVVLMREELTDAPVFEGDPARLGLALGELVKNARQALPPGGTVGLRVRAEGPAVAFEVWDTGPGVPPRVRARLGEAFLQPDAVLTDHTPGLGLGLAFAHLVATRHGGTLTVSDRPGGGAVVRLVVPKRAVAGPAGGQSRGAIGGNYGGGVARPRAH